MNDIIVRMRNGERISETAPELLCDEIENTRRLIAELNTGTIHPMRYAPFWNASGGSGLTAR